MRQNLAVALIVPQEVLTKQIVASHFIEYVIYYGQALSNTISRRNRYKC
ncbi:MAG: hypothetical protein U9N42_02315 [Campylobacterota bacterium]|nr:hypothetical protein [Campylobacterota bacterium]